MLSDGATARAPEITRVAARLFRQSGYRDTSIRNIAAALDIKSASLYYHFSKKDDILFAIAHGLMHDFVEQVTPVFFSVDDPGSAIADTVKAHLEFESARLDEALVSTRERRSLPIEMQRPINALRSRHRQALEQRIADGIEQGIFAPQDLSIAANAVLDLVSGVKEWYSSGKYGELDDLVPMYQGFALALLER